MTQTQDRAVVDTNIISYLFKGDVKRAALYKTDLENRQLIISFVTVAELFVWAYSKGWGQPRISQMREKLRQYVVYPVDNDLVDAWAHLVANAQLAGRGINANDAWVAATA